MHKKWFLGDFQSLARSVSFAYAITMVNQKDDKGILNSMYAHKSSSLACIGALSSIL